MCFSLSVAHSSITLWVRSLIVCLFCSNISQLLPSIQHHLDSNVVTCRYFLVLAVYDLVLSIFYIPIVVTATGCRFRNYTSALYFAHFGWTTACTFHALGTYVIVFLSMDRFVGVWFPTWFKTLQQPPFGFWHRMAAVAVVCVGVHVPFMVDAAVECWESSNEDTGMFKSISNQTSDTSCTNGSWVSIDGFEYSFDETWHTVYRYFYNMIVRWLPSGVLFVLNFSLVTAVILGKVKLPGEAGEAENEKARAGTSMDTLRKGSRRMMRNSERILVVTVIAMTASYVLLTLPITIFLTALANTGTERCVTSSPEETLRHIGNILQLLEHVLHVFFLFLINPRFRRETLYLLRCRESGADEDTNSPDDQLTSGNRPVSHANRYSSITVRVRDSNMPVSCQSLRNDFS